VKAERLPPVISMERTSTCFVDPAESDRGSGAERVARGMGLRAVAPGDRAGLAARVRSLAGGRVPEGMIPDMARAKAFTRAAAAEALSRVLEEACQEGRRR